MRTHEQLVKKLLRRRGVRTEVERIEREESALLDALLKARQEAGLTQSEVAARMGTQAPAVARLERAPGQWKTFPIDRNIAEVCEGLWQTAGAEGCVNTFEGPSFHRRTSASTKDYLTAPPSPLHLNLSPP